MKAIITKYRGPTNTRAPRITAHDSDGNRATVSRSVTEHIDDSHAAAAIALCSKMGWTGQLYPGDLNPNERVFVWLDLEHQPAITIDEVPQ